MKPRTGGNKFTALDFLQAYSSAADLWRSFAFEIKAWNFVQRYIKR